MGFLSDFSGKMEEFVQNFRRSPLSRLRGRSEIRDPRCNSLLFSKKLTKLSTVDCRLSTVNFQKKIPQQSISRQKSSVDFKACQKIGKLDSARQRGVSFRDYRIQKKEIRAHVTLLPVGNLVRNFTREVWYRLLERIAASASCRPCPRY
jgi:hypothetical protein